MKIILNTKVVKAVALILIGAALTAVLVLCLSGCGAFGDEADAITAKHAQAYAERVSLGEDPEMVAAEEGASATAELEALVASEVQKQVDQKTGEQDKVILAGGLGYHLWRNLKYIKTGGWLGLLLGLAGSAASPTAAPVPPKTRSP